jgi:hypothetical protein
MEEIPYLREESFDAEGNCWKRVLIEGTVPLPSSAKIWLHIETHLDDGRVFGP